MTEYGRCEWCGRKVKLFLDAEGNHPDGKKGYRTDVHRYSKRRVLCIQGSLKVIRPVPQLEVN